MPRDRTADTMLTFARQRLAYADLVIRTGGDREQVSEELVHAVTQQLGHIPAINPDTATDLIALVESSPIMEDDKRAIVMAVQGKVNVAVPPSSLDEPERGKHQSFLKCPEYMQSNLAIVQMYAADAEADVDGRLKMIAMLFRKMSCNSPSERTMAVGAACAVPEATSAMDRVALSGAKGKELLQKFKYYFKKSPVQMIGTEPQIFPSFTDCEAMLPLQFQMNGFAPGENNPIWDAEKRAQILEIGMSIPLRWTNNMVTGTSFKPGGSPVHKASSRANLYTRMLNNFCNEKLGGDVPGLVIYDRPQAAMNDPESMFQPCRQPSLQWSPPPQQPPPLLAMQQQQHAAAAAKARATATTAAGEPPAAPSSMENKPKPSPAPMANKPEPPLAPNQPEPPLAPMEHQPEHDRLPKRYRDDDTSTSAGEGDTESADGDAEMVAADTAVNDMLSAMSATRTPTKSKKSKVLLPTTATPKAKAQSKATVKGEEKTTKRMSINVQWSISQVLARTGLPATSGRPGSKGFKFKHQSEIPKCKKLAEKWLQQMGVWT